MGWQNGETELHQLKSPQMGHNSITHHTEIRSIYECMYDYTYISMNNAALIWSCCLRLILWTHNCNKLGVSCITYPSLSLCSFFVWEIGQHTCSLDLLYLDLFMLLAFWFLQQGIGIFYFFEQVSVSCLYLTDRYK